MTEEQSKMLRETIDLNWDFSHETNPSKKWQMGMALAESKRKLRESMGAEEYDRFMDTGRRMFAPKSEADAAD